MLNVGHVSVLIRFTKAVQVLQWQMTGLEFGVTISSWTLQGRSACNARIMVKVVCCSAGKYSDLLCSVLAFIKILLLQHHCGFIKPESKRAMFGCVELRSRGST